MTSLLHGTGVALGSRRPRVRSVPERVDTAGPEATALARSAGLDLDLWQQDAVGDILAEGPDQRWAARRTYVIVPRQNGKGALIEAVELYGLFILNETILHSAHLFDTAREAFMRIKMLIEQTPDLQRRVKRVSEAHGKEGIELHTGGRLHFHARSKGGGRGKSPHRVILDEAFALTREHMAALVPALSAQDDPQINAFSTPPPVGEPCEVLIHARRQVLDAIDSGRRAEVAWLEWGVERGTDVTDPRTWAVANPALGIRITERTIRDELDALGPPEFAVERCGQWPPMGDAQWLVIPEADWRAAADPTDERAGRPCFSLEMSPDRSWAAICAAWHRPDGLQQVQVIDQREGTTWIPQRVTELQAKHDPVSWVVARDSPAVSEVPALEQAGLTVARMSFPDAIAGTGLLYDGIVGDWDEGDGARAVRHAGQDQVDAAMAAAVKRPPNDKAWSFDRARPGAYLILGEVGALWGLATHIEEPDQPFFGSWR
jgi:hypothetical protein